MLIRFTVGPKSVAAALSRTKSFYTYNLFDLYIIRSSAYKMIPTNFLALLIDQEDPPAKRRIRVSLGSLPEPGSPIPPSVVIAV